MKNINSPFTETDFQQTKTEGEKKSRDMEISFKFSIFVANNKSPNN